MSANRVMIVFTLDEASCLNNALRAELDRAGRRRSDPDWLGFDEYARRLDACIGKVGKAFAEAMGQEASSRDEIRKTA